MKIKILTPSKEELERFKSESITDKIIKRDSTGRTRGYYKALEEQKIMVDKECFSKGIIEK